MSVGQKKIVNWIFSPIIKHQQGKQVNFFHKEWSKLAYPNGVSNRTQCNCPKTGPV